MSEIPDELRIHGGRLRMDAYYYGFDRTGCEPVDLILAAVAWAGKAYHHTEWWSDPIEDMVPPVELIQSMADAAADEIERLRAWKAEATVVLNAVADIAQSTIRSEIERLRPALQAVLDSGAYPEAAIALEALTEWASDAHS